MISDLDSRFNIPQLEEILSVISSAFPKGIEKASQIASSGVLEEAAD